jgi:hypothetical protein
MGVKNPQVTLNAACLHKKFTISYFLQMRMKLKDKAHRAITKKVAKKGLKGEADRFIGTKKPRHLYVGKRGIGKTDRR